MMLTLSSKIGKEPFSLMKVEVDRGNLESEVFQDDLVLLTIKCLNVHLHKTDPVLQIHPVSRVWLRAQGLRKV